MAATWKPVKVPKIPKKATKVPVLPKSQPMAPAPIHVQQVMPAPRPPRLTPQERLAQNPDGWKDSSYNTALAMAAQQKQQGLASLNTAGARAGEDHQTTLQRLVEAQKEARGSTTSGANKQGLFYSGQLGKRLTDVDTQYGRQNADLVRAFQRGEEDRATGRAQLESGEQMVARQAQDQAMLRFIAQAQAQEVPEVEMPPELAALIASLTTNIGGS